MNRLRAGSESVVGVLVTMELLVAREYMWEDGALEKTRVVGMEFSMGPLLTTSCPRTNTTVYHKLLNFPHSTVTCFHSWIHIIQQTKQISST